MKKTVYHGSDHIIERPKYGYGKIYNDYGVGFYCTENQNMAKEWGVSADKNGYANRYEIECDGLKVLNLNMRDYTMLHWLTILLMQEFSLRELFLLQRILLMVQFLTVS